mmetsp:Transcript_39087/g.59592  ORF Transcript_39087/g.59592 Transcript_39087/m.59592 type:complete len:263 (+) Transcript_39087:4421-5209(+)
MNALRLEEEVPAEILAFFRFQFKDAGHQNRVGTQQPHELKGFLSDVGLRVEQREEHVEVLLAGSDHVSRHLLLTLSRLKYVTGVTILRNPLKVVSVSKVLKVLANGFLVALQALIEVELLEIIDANDLRLRLTVFLLENGQALVVLFHFRVRARGDESHHFILVESHEPIVVCGEAQEDFFYNLMSAQSKLRLSCFGVVSHNRSLLCHGLDLGEGGNELALREFHVSQSGTVERIFDVQLLDANLDNSEVHRMIRQSGTGLV